MSTASSLLAMLGPLGVLVVVIAGFVAGVAGDADLSESGSDEVPYASHFFGGHSPFASITPLSPISSRSYENEPRSYSHGTPSSHVSVIHHSRSKPSGRKKPKVTRLPVSHANPFIPIHPDYTVVYGKRPSHDCPAYTKCVPLVVCSPFYSEIEDHSYSPTCPLYGKAKGICCPDLKLRDRSVRLFSEPRVKVRKMSFSNDVINEAARSSLWQLEERDKLENILQYKRVVISKPGTAEFAHLQFFRTSPRAMRISRDGLTGVGASDYLVTRFRLDPLEAAFGLQQISLSNSIIENTCPEVPRCDKRSRFYRTIDGSCNNVDSPSLGQARTPLTRITMSRYFDGLMRPRMSVTGAVLPSPRLVSTSVIPDADIPNTDLSLYVMLFGQFVDHDLSHTPVFRFDNASGIECCSNNGLRFVERSFLHPSCLPIPIPADDPYHSRRTGRRCMNFVRSMIAPKHCNLGFAEQMNQLTHYLDSSNIYGSSEEEERELRAFTDGLLRVQERGLLPVDPDAMECTSATRGAHCFKAGDERVNEQVLLTVMHTVWMRFHNLIARELKRLNPYWNDETLYQEARRIVNAMYQHIVYNEWLPIILGKDFMAEMNLLPLRYGYSSEYDPKVNPQIANEFSTAAFRFGHTLVQGMIDLVSKRGRRTETLDLVTQFNNPILVYTPGKLDEFLRGIASQHPQRTDNFVTSALTNRLFESDDMPFGMDLVALNIQRGRDHAIGTYNDLREVCGLPRARTFEDFLDYLPKKVVAAFSRLYDSVDDVDPFVAGISERYAPDAILGPTFRCIVADQFARTRRGDRFFYDLGGMPSSFTKDQLQQIRRISLARVLCETGDNIMFMQPLAFWAAKGINERVSCDDPTIPHIDLTPWTSSRGTYY